MNTTVEDLPADAVIWRTAGGDNSRHGLFPRRVRIESRPSRRLSAQGAIHASVVFDQQGRAFVADRSGHVQSFSTDGRLIWRTQVDGGITATPAVHPAEPLLFAGTHLGMVYALDTTSGAIRWQKEIPTKSDPRILSDLLFNPANDTVVFSSWGGRFVALAAENGHEHSSWDAGISPYAAAAADKTGHVFCLRAVGDKGVEFVRVTKDGTETVLLSESAGDRGARRALVTATPVIDDSRGVAYYITNADKAGVLRAWSIPSGRPLWQHPLPITVRATPTLSPDGAIVVCDLAGHIHRFSPEGAPLWRYSTDCDYLLAGGALEAGGTFFTGDPLGQLHVVNAEGRGKVLFEATRSIEAGPSLSPTGDLHFPSTDRTVYVFRASR